MEVHMSMRDIGCPSNSCGSLMVASILLFLLLPDSTQTNHFHHVSISVRRQISGRGGSRRAGVRMVVRRC
jgi:hypothetical protein